MVAACRCNLRGGWDVRPGAPHALYFELTQCVRRRNKLFQLYVVELASGYAGNGVINIDLATDFSKLKTRRHKCNTR